MKQQLISGRFFNKQNVPFFSILLIGSFLRFYRLKELMSFIGDQGLFYLPALKMDKYGIIPLVGPETSHPWIHHGPLWTYTLAIILRIFNLDPVPTAYFIAILGTVTIFIFYFAVKSMFDKRIALLSALLFATSPFIVVNARYPYHTSVLPFLVTSLLFLTYKLINGKSWALPFITLLLAVLYNHEIISFVYSISIGVILLFGFVKKESWLKRLLNVKLIFLSVITFLIPMVPFILYDTTHGWKQTFGFLVWVLYRVAKFPLSLVDSKFASPASSPETFSNLFLNYRDLVFAPNTIVAFIVLITTVLFTVRFFTKAIKFKKDNFFKSKINIPISYALIFLFLTVSLGGLLIHRVPIPADLLLISPFILILTTISLFWIFRRKFFIVFIATIIISFFNIYHLLSTSFLTNINGEKVITYPLVLDASNKILSISSGSAYNLEGRGALSNFESFLMSYEYLLIWGNHPPSEKSVPLKIIIWQKESSIEVYQGK